MTTDKLIFGPVAGITGTLQAIEAIKINLGSKTVLNQAFLIYNALNQKISKYRLKKPDCQVCNNLSEKGE